MQRHERVEYLLVVRTDSYAGNFEREMGAYMTAQYGECEVGDREAEQARRELPPDVVGWCGDHVTQESDEHGVLRPVELGVPNTTFHIFMDEPPSADLCRLFLERGSAWGSKARTPVKVLSVAIVKRVEVTTEEELATFTREETSCSDPS